MHSDWAAEKISPLFKKVILLPLACESHKDHKGAIARLPLGFKQAGKEMEYFLFGKKLHYVEKFHKLHEQFSQVILLLEFGTVNNG